MISYQDLQQLNNDLDRITSLIIPLKEQTAELELECGVAGFWDNLEYAQKKTKELGNLKAKLDVLQKMSDDWEFCNMLEDEMNSSAYVDDNDDYELAIDELFNKVQSWKKEQLLNGKYDDMPAVLTFHAGSGGTEACDFTEMILRAVSRWAESSNFSVKVTDMEKGDVAGIKTATIELIGEHAYGYTKAFNGVFRLVRVSPFDAANRRHTSFMAIDVIPLIEDDNTIEINPDDIEMEMMRAHVHAGGQNVNKVNSAVRITHKPTGIVIRYDAERSQLQNRNAAMGLLKAKLLQMKLDQQNAELKDISGEKQENGWGNAICSIVLMPYQLVKDNRSNWESSNTNAFLCGDMDGFINSYLEWNNGR